MAVLNYVCGAGGSKSAFTPMHQDTKTIDLNSAIIKLWCTRFRCKYIIIAT
jgi:hypothetical protein